MLNLSITEVPESKNTRGERVHLPEELVDAVYSSFDNGKAVTVEFATETEAKGVATKLRTRLNNEEHGLRTWGPTATDNGTWSITFKGKSDIGEHSDPDDSPEAVDVRVTDARQRAIDNGKDPQKAEDRIRLLVARRAARQ